MSNSLIKNRKFNLNKIVVLFLELDLPKLIIINLIILFFGATVGFAIVLPMLEFSDLHNHGHEFSLLADSFLEGKLYISKSDQLDCTMVGGKCYWPLGPFPALILLPFVFIFNFFNLPFYQGYLIFLIAIIIFFLVYKLAQKFYYSAVDSLWLAFAFCFASVYLGIAFEFEPYYLAHAVSVLFLFLAFFEYFNQKRYFLIGLYFAFIFATRFSAGLGILFFILLIFFAKDLSFKDKIKQFFFLGSPVFISGLLLLYYNFIRFGNPFDNGYVVALGGNIVLRSRYGLFNLYYFVSNFYYYFLKMPEVIFNKVPFIKASPSGLSFFIVSPIFIKIFWANFKNKLVIFSWLSSLVVLFLILTYYHSGGWQFGPRYILDLLPFWFLLLLMSFKDHLLKIRHQLIIGFSALVNFFLFSSLYF